MSLRAVMRIGSTLSVSGEEVSDVPMVLYQPFSIQNNVKIGSSLSVFGILRVGKTLSVLDSFELGSTLSLRGGCRLGSSLSVLDVIRIGSSLSLRTFNRLGSSLSVFGNVRLGSRLTVFDNLCLDPSQKIKFEGWSIGWDAGTSKLQFTADGVAQPPLQMSTTGGELHGTWTVESIVSASDRRLKRQILPLAKSLRASGTHSSEAPTASKLLEALNPMRFKGSDPQSTATPGLSRSQKEPRIAFQADEVEEVLPDLVRPAPALATDSGVGKGILYQDFIALLTLATQERQRRLEQHQIREHEETVRIQQQEALIEVLERQMNALRGRFRRLRSWHPTPPEQMQ